MFGIAVNSVVCILAGSGMELLSVQAVRLGLSWVLICGAGVLRVVNLGCMYAVLFLLTLPLQWSTCV